MKNYKIFIWIFVLPFVINGQTKINGNHSTQNLTCSTCHSCDIPTKENPCIKVCPRESMIRIDQPATDAPKIFVIDKIRETDIYAAVKFSHLTHAEMSGLAGGCRTCHHYNPPGNVIGCSDCHESSRKRTDISKPDLKGAYHQQCMNCHRAWSGSTNCTVCHELKGKEKSQTAVVSNNGKRIHPEIKTPDKISFATKTKQGKLVTFYHNEHINLFNLECSDCHSNESCIKCHAADKTTSAKKISEKVKHKKCSSCHNTAANCSSCHSNSEAGGFNHKSVTGFDLSKFHSKLDCTRCHTNGSGFKGLNNECKSCHGTWTLENFKHKSTGLALDETHSELECENCHKESSYSKPVCEDCHDDKSYPNNLPGKRVK